MLKRIFRSLLTFTYSPVSYIVFISMYFENNCNLFYLHNVPLKKPIEILNLKSYSTTFLPTKNRNILFAFLLNLYIPYTNDSLLDV